MVLCIVVSPAVESLVHPRVRRHQQRYVLEGQPRSALTRDCFQAFCQVGGPATWSAMRVRSPAVCTGMLYSRIAFAPSALRSQYVRSCLVIRPPSKDDIFLTIRATRDFRAIRIGSPPVLGCLVQTSSTELELLAVACPNRGSRVSTGIAILIHCLHGHDRLLASPFSRTQFLPRLDKR